LTSHQVHQGAVNSAAQSVNGEVSTEDVILQGARQDVVGATTVAVGAISPSQNKVGVPHSLAKKVTDRNLSTNRLEFGLALKDLKTFAPELFLQSSESLLDIVKHAFTGNDRKVNVFSGQAQQSIPHTAADFVKGEVFHELIIGRFCGEV
jgi:hypothetical protein